MGETRIGHTANCVFLTCYTAVKVKFNNLKRLCTVNIPDISGPYQSVSEVDLVDLEAHFRWMTSSEFQVVSTQEWKIQKLDNPNGK